MTRLYKGLAALVIAFGLFVIQAFPAFACGGLIAPDGDVRLSRAATLVAWHDGIERYMTSFTYEGDVSKLGWIVPLPAVPLKIEEGGAWTLQRLFRETHPLPVRAAILAPAASTANSVQVLEQVKVEALNITVLRGSGQAVVDWATSNGFLLNDDTRAHLLIYAKGSPILMAAKYDTTAVRTRHQLEGDGAPVLITMRTAHIWVPLEVLALDGQDVNADIYFLTDTPINTSDLNAKFGQSAVDSEVPSAPGMKLAFQERMNSTLYHDLSTDRNMSWVWPNSWLTYLSLNAPYTKVTYDLGVSPSGIIRLAPFGTAPMAVVDGQSSRELPGWVPGLPLGTPETLLWTLFVMELLGLGFLAVRAMRRAKMRG